MTASGGLYPSLGRYFSNLTELAHAGCMSRTRARECLDGVKTFTRAEKKAISANIVTGILTRSAFINYAELEAAIDAWNGQFDEIYKKRG